MTPTEKDAMALAVLAQVANECEAVGIADAAAELERQWAQEISQARAHLASRIAELEHQVSVLVPALGRSAKGWEESLTRATRAEAELAAVREDAERYRWLRDHRDEEGFVDPEIHVAVDSHKFPNQWALVGEDLDAAIDAVRGGE